LVNTLFDELQWQQDKLKFYGKIVDIPRLQAWYGEYGVHYTYSNLTMVAKPWTPTLLQLKNIISQYCQSSFNAVLANCYRDNCDSVGWHSDDEPELGQNPVIASLSLGGTRTFHLKHKHTGEKFKLPLQSGSLLVMSGKTQHYWQHAILKTKQKAVMRINLTFRNILSNRP